MKPHTLKMESDLAIVKVAVADTARERGTLLTMAMESSLPSIGTTGMGPAMGLEVGLAPATGTASIMMTTLDTAVAVDLEKILASTERKAQK